MMSDLEFDEKLKQIEQTYGAGREGVEARRDQELSRLFNECEWTQDRIARKIGRHQTWVSLRLRFGAFLSFMTTGHKTEISTQSLTERAFRSLWSQTKGKEQERFEKVAELLKARECATTGYKNLIKKPGYGDEIRSILSNGKWHTVESVVSRMREKFPEFDRVKFANQIAKLRLPKGKMLQTQGRGERKRCRMSDAKASPDVAQTKTLELYEQIKPLIDEIEFWGTRHIAEVSVQEIRRIGIKLQRVFDSILQTEHA